MNPNFKRIIKKAALTSKALQDQKEIILSFPPSYRKEKRYPVLLLHDGDDYIRMGRIVTQANPMIDRGELNPFLIVAVPVLKERRNQEYSPLGEHYQAHMQFILEELRPFLEANYPADCSPESWVLGGSSLGGTISLHIALTYPQYCKRILSQSGAFLPITMEKIRQVDTLTLQIYQSIGLDETAIPTHAGELDLLAQNREAHRLFVEKQAQVSYTEFAGGHTWRHWQQELPQALQFFFAPKI